MYKNMNFHVDICPISYYNDVVAQIYGRFL